MTRIDLFEVVKVNTITCTGYLIAKWHGFITFMAGVTNAEVQNYLTTSILFFIMVYNVLKVFASIRDMMNGGEDD